MTYYVTSGQGRSTYICRWVDILCQHQVRRGDRGGEEPWRGGRGALGAAAARSQSFVLPGVIPVLGARQTPPPALSSLILGRDSLFAFSGCVCAGDSAASGTRRCLTLWHGAQGHFVGALCARGDVGRPAFNVCWCFPGADHLVLGGGVGSDSVLGG